MSNVRIIIILLVVNMGALSSPIDTAYDLLDAITYEDGYALEQLLSADLYFTLTSFLDQARALVETDPVLSENLLLSRYGGRITIADFEVLNNEEILGRILAEVSLQPDEQIERETADMHGRTASVVFFYFNGASISFEMVWENSNWRVTNTSLLAILFR